MSVDYNAWMPDLMFLSDPTADTVIEFLREYISINGISERIKTDPGTLFKTRTYNKFCKVVCIGSVVCSVRDHRGIGKVESMIRAINER